MKLLYLAVNLVGGLAVLYSYGYGITAHPGSAHELWGTIPAAWQGPYSAFMPPAAVGYLLVFGVLMATPADRLRVFGRPALPLFTANTALFLFASTLWMPLTFAALDTDNLGWFKYIQLTLAVAGACAALQVPLVAKLEGVGRGWRRAATAGALALAWQCTVLDAIVWPRFFTV